MPEGIARLLSVLGWIIGYGKALADSLPRMAADADFPIFAARFRRPDFTEIRARIKRGLLVAAALAEKLRRRAGTGRDVVPAPYRYFTPRSRTSTGGAGKRTRVRHTNIVDMPPDILPSAEQIAAELQRRPVGAVLADICRDLGIRPGDLTRQQWDELSNLILTYGGSPVDVLFAEANLRLRWALQAAPRATAPAPAECGAPSNQAARPTGPPPLQQAA